MVTSDRVGPGRPRPARTTWWRTGRRRGPRRRLEQLGLGQVALGQHPKARTGRRASAAPCMARQLVNRARVRPPAAVMSGPSSSCSAWRALGAAGVGEVGGAVQQGARPVREGAAHVEVVGARRREPEAVLEQRRHRGRGEHGGHRRATGARPAPGPPRSGATRSAGVRPAGPEASTQATWSAPSAGDGAEVLDQVAGGQQGPVAPRPVVVAGLPPRPAPPARLAVGPPQRRRQRARAGPGPARARAASSWRRRAPGRSPAVGAAQHPPAGQRARAPRRAGRPPSATPSARRRRRRRRRGRAPPGPRPAAGRR